MALKPLNPKILNPKVLGFKVWEFGFGLTLRIIALEGLCRHGRCAISYAPRPFCSCWIRKWHHVASICCMALWAPHGRRRATLLDVRHGSQSTHITLQSKTPHGLRSSGTGSVLLPESSRWQQPTAGCPKRPPDKCCSQVPCIVDRAALIQHCVPGLQPILQPSHVHNARA